MNTISANIISKPVSIPVGTPVLFRVNTRRINAFVIARTMQDDGTYIYRLSTDKNLMSKMFIAQEKQKIKKRAETTAAIERLQETIYEDVYANEISIRYDELHKFEVGQAVTLKRKKNSPTYHVIKKMPNKEAVTYQISENTEILKEASKFMKMVSNARGTNLKKIAQKSFDDYIQENTIIITEDKLKAI